MQEHQKLIEARDIMIDAFGKIYALSGVSEVTGRIYGLLYFSNHPMGLDEIAEELKVSKATVSVNVRFLEGLKSIRKVWMKGSRRDYYEAQRDIANILMEQLLTNMQKELEITSGAIKKSRELLAEITDEWADTARQYNEYITILERNYEWSFSFIQGLLEASKRNEVR